MKTLHQFQIKKERREVVGKMEKWKNAFFTLLDPLDRVRETAKNGFLFVLELELRCATRSILAGLVLDPTLGRRSSELFSRSYGLLVGR